MAKVKEETEDELFSDISDADFLLLCEDVLATEAARAQKDTALPADQPAAAVPALFGLSSSRSKLTRFEQLENRRISQVKPAHCKFNYILH